MPVSSQSSNGSPRELFDADITIRGDSLLAIQQMFGAWKINKGIYAPLAYKARGLRTQFTNMRGEWIERTTTRLPMGWRRLRTWGCCWESSLWLSE